MQSIVSFLRSLNLRSDVNTVTSFKSVVEEVSGSGNGFPFTGDATIDGTLNIDFTGTLDFYSGDSLELEGDPVIEAILKGDMIGLHFSEGDNEIYSGLVDGVVDIFSGFAEVGIKGHYIQYKDKDSGDFVTSSLGRYLFPPEVEDGSEDVYITPMQAVFVESTGTFSEYIMRAERKIGTDDSSFILLKVVDDGVNPQFLGIGMDSGSTSIDFINGLLDDSASVYRFKNNQDDTILDLWNDNIQSDVILSRDYVDDAAAETGGVPIGGIYHNGGILRIRVV